MANTQTTTVERILLSRIRSPTAHETTAAAVMNVKYRFTSVTLLPNVSTMGETNTPKQGSGSAKANAHSRQHATS